MKQRLIVVSLLGLSTNVDALELELGVGYSLIDPFYQSVDKERFPEQYDDHIVGKLGLSHTFKINKWSGVKLWIEHYSLINHEEPLDTNTGVDNAGKNLVGASVVFKLF